MWGALSEERMGQSFTTAAGFASAVIPGSESSGTHDHVLLFQIRGSTNLEGQVPVFMSPPKSSPVIPPDTGLPFRRLLRLARLWWRDSNTPPRGEANVLSRWSL
jgi:hypothetical protein